MAKAGSYEGDIVNGVRHGFGKFVYPNKFFVYEGEWQNGQKHGQGTLFLGDGGSYSGTFDSGEMTGKGTREWSDGRAYSGDFILGEPHGEGKLTYPEDGGHYDGSWEFGRFHGKGTLMMVDEWYKGDFFEGKAQGYGRAERDDGEYYEGDWNNGRREGTGTVRLANGTIYKGSWLDDNWHGIGVMDDPQTGIQYDGEWEDNRPALAPCNIGHRFMLDESLEKIQPSDEQKKDKMATLKKQRKPKKPVGGRKDSKDKEKEKEKEKVEKDAIPNREEAMTAGSQHMPDDQALSSPWIPHLPLVLPTNSQCLPVLEVSVISADSTVVEMESGRFFQISVEQKVVQSQGKDKRKKKEAGGSQKRSESVATPPLSTRSRQKSAARRRGDESPREEDKKKGKKDRKKEDDEQDMEPKEEWKAVAFMQAATGDAEPTIMMSVVVSSVEGVARFPAIAFETPITNGQYRLIVSDVTPHAPLLPDIQRLINVE